jgi:polysaccharide deacetylase 2 family uncharacterized protein YibQ
MGGLLMSEDLKDSSENAAAAPPAKRSPNPWTRVAIGLAVFALASGFCAKLVYSHLASRPVDLRAHTTALVDIAEQVLVELNVPKEKITRTEAQLREEPTATFFASGVTAELLPGVQLQSVVEPFKRKMSMQSVSVADGSPGALTQDMTFSLMEHPFLSVRVTATPIRDLSATTNQIADEIAVTLQTQGVAPGAIHRSLPENKEDGSFSWTFHAIAAPLPEGASPESMEKTIGESLTVSEVRVTPRLGLQGASILSVTHQDRLCAEVRLDVAAPELASSDDDETPFTLQPIQKNEETAAPAPSENEDSQKYDVPNEDEVPLDSNGLDSMELGRKLTGVKYPGTTIPRVAIIVDDGGYGGPVTEKVLALTPKLTVAVLPYTPAAKKTASKAAELGFQVMLHVPMEPAKMKGCMTTKMSRQEILKTFEEELAEIPEASGVNNHVGSIFTSNEQCVTIFLEGVKNHPLFFIDSRTSAKSKGYEVAKSFGIPTAMRDVFLDNEPEANYIIGQFNHLMDVAKERGTAIGICHFRTKTVPVLTQMLPQLERNGIELVHVSELLKTPAKQENGQ